MGDSKNRNGRRNNLKSYKKIIKYLCFNLFLKLNFNYKKISLYFGL